MALFDLKYALSSVVSLLESGVKSERAKADREIGPELKNREISFLTPILGRMTPIGFFLFLILKELFK